MKVALSAALLTIAATTLTSSGIPVVVASSRQPDRLQKFLGNWSGNDELNRQAVGLGATPLHYGFLISKIGDLLVTRRGFVPASDLAYRLDGSLLEVKWNNRPQQSQMTWNGDALVLEVKAITQEREGAAGQDQDEVQVFTFEGDRLVIETARRLRGKMSTPYKLYFDRDDPRHRIDPFLGTWKEADDSILTVYPINDRLGMKPGPPLSKEPSVPYRLNGLETQDAKNSIPVMTRLSWDAGTLILETTSAENRTLKERQVLTLSGDRLTIQSSGSLTSLASTAITHQYERMAQSPGNRPKANHRAVTLSSFRMSRLQGQ